MWSLAVMPTAFAAVPSADQWAHIENVPGGTACAARLVGDEVDTMLMFNETGQLILVAGRADWHASGPAEISLRIDRFEPTHLTASAFNNLVLLPVGDQVVIERLKAAKDLYWSFPFGSYHAAVSGLGDALAWVRQCERDKRRNSGGGS